MLKIAVTGLRGIPDIQGGVETHCAELFPLISSDEMEITVFGRGPYSSKPRKKLWKNIKLIWLPTIPTSKLEAFVHTFLSVITAKIKGFDIIHIHACGPGLFVPLAKRLGMKVVFTHHGEDYKREKWGGFTKKILKLGEKLAVKNADAVICVSPHISDMIMKEYGLRTESIPNGVSILESHEETDILRKHGIENSNYILSVGRIVPEKGFDRLIRAYAKSEIGKEFKLVIAGGAQNTSHYANELNRLASEKGVIMTGIVSRADIMALLKGAMLFVLASSHEGLPIALLEAMACGKDVLVNDIPACHLPQLDESDFFNANEENSLETALKTKLANRNNRVYDLTDYSWEKAARKTLEIYRKL